MIQPVYDTIFFLGPPGCGKDTQVILLHQILPESATLGMSAIFKHFIQQDPEFLGMETAKIARGKLVDCSLTIMAFERYIQEMIPKPAPRIWKVNGIPRTGKQARQVVAALPQERRLLPRLALMGKLPPEVSLKRCLDRAEKDEVAGCRREDDTPEKIRERVEIYFQENGAVYSGLEGSGVIVREFDARGTPEHIHELVLHYIQGGSN